jgi:hypothetical protein
MTRRFTAFTWLILLAAFYVGFAFGVARLWDYDFWWHLKTGQLILQQHAVPHADPFSWTRPGAPWTAHEWGWDLVLYLVYRLGGWLGLIYLKAAVSGICAVLAAYLAVRWGAGLLPALAVTALMSAAVAVWINARPEMLIILYVLLILHVLTSHREGRPRTLWWLPVIFLFWANTHGAFLIGWALLGLYAVCEALQPSRVAQASQPASALPPEAGLAACATATPAAGLAACATLRGDLRRAWPRPGLRGLVPLILPGLASVLICVVNPNGVQGALYPFSYVFGANAYHAQIITEYASPDFHQAIFVWVEALMLVTILALILSPQAPSLWELALLLAGMYLFLTWARNGPLLAVFCVPLAAGHLSARARRSRWLAWLSEQQMELRPLVAAVAAVIVVLGLALIAPHNPSPSQTIDASLLPLRATQVVQLNAPRGLMFDSYEFGGYLIWELWPRYKVYIDGRADMYGRTTVQEYEQVFQLQPGWQDVLKRRKIEWLLVHADGTLAHILEAGGDYAVLYQDDTAVLFARRGGVNQRLIDEAQAGKLKLPPEG